MKPEHELRIRNGKNSDDLKIHMEVNGVIENNDTGKLVANVADDTLVVNFRGTIEVFDVIRGTGSAYMNGKFMSFNDLVGYDTSNGVSPEIDGETNDNHNSLPEFSYGVLKKFGHPLSNPDTNRGCVARAYSTDGEVVMHVGKDKDYESLQGAFNDVPHYVNHDVTIYVHGRTQDTNTAHICNVSMANNPHFTVQGVSGRNGRAIINKGGVNVSINGKMDHIRLNDLEFEMITQCINARFENCLFAPDADNQCCFSGKEGGKMLVDCKFKAGADYCVVSIGSETVEMRGCVLRANKAAVDAHSASQQVFNYGNKLHAPKWVDGGSSKVYYGGEKIA